MGYFGENYEERCLLTGAPTHLSFFAATFALIFLVLNVPGNFLVILAVTRDPYKNLRGPFNYLLANLALADLIVGIVTLPLSISFYLKDGLGKKLPLNQILTLHISFLISCTASVLSLTSLAVERYLAICSPLTYRNKCTGKRVLITVGGIWFLSLTLPFLYFGVGPTTYSFIFCNTLLVVAVSITCFTYAMMLYNSKQRIKKLKKTGSNQDLEEAPTRATNPLHDNAVLLEQKITNMFLVVMISFLCCFGPSTIFIYAVSFCESCSCSTLYWLVDLHFLFAVMNSNVNFFCYGLRSRRFRHAFARILRITGLNQTTRASRSTTVPPF